MSIFQRGEIKVAHFMFGISKTPFYLVITIFDKTSSQQKSNPKHKDMNYYAAIKNEIQKVKIGNQRKDLFSSIKTKKNKFHFTFF
jgi:hypothetical protein